MAKHPGGRPTKLTRALVDKAQKYIDEEIMFGGQFNGDLPTVAGLAIYLDVGRRSIYDWAEQNTPLALEFSHTLEKLMARQQYMLVGKSLKGDYNPTIAKMLLNVNHDMIEKSKTDVTTNGNEIKGASIIFADDPSSTDN